MTATPSMVIHEIASGGVLDGSLSDGSLVALKRERYNKWLAGTKGGLFETDENDGFRAESIMWNLPGVTEVSAYLVDEDDVEYLVETVSGASGSLRPRNDGVLVIPGWKLKLVGSGTLTADGRVAVVMGQGWGQSTLDHAPELGMSNRVPSIEGNC